MLPGDIVALEERHDHAGFKWVNYRLVKVMRTAPPFSSILVSYLPYPGGRVMEPVKSHRVLTVDAWRRAAAECWHRSNHFTDCATFAQLTDLITGKRIKV